jgi:hypothetical protein
VLIGLISDPPLELAGANLGAAGRIEWHSLLDLVRLKLLGRLGTFLAHGVASCEKCVRDDLEDDGQMEESRAQLISEAWGKIGILFCPLL